MYIVKGHNWHWPAPSPRERVTILLVAILATYVLAILTLIHYGSGVWNSIFVVTLFACPVVLGIVCAMLYWGAKPFTLVSGRRLNIYKDRCHVIIIAVGFVVVLSWAGSMAQT